LLTYLTPHEVSFFTLLDAQLDKVESFYLEREKEMLARGQMLQLQLRELQDHRRLFHSSIKEEGDATASITSNVYQPSPRRIKMGKRNTQEDATSTNEDFEENARLFKELKDRQQQLPLSSDPDSYIYAKRKLKKAVLEHYRGLEVLHNYRVLNITGFRKALKKFEKVTRISAQNQYMTEKVDQSAFASDKAIGDMMSQMEELFATAFSSGDRKKALRRLRAGGKSKSHHFSTFRTGVLLGLALPAFVEGLFVSGSRRVEFKDFWLGDQLCSLSFTLSNLYPFACVYARGFPTSVGQCGTGGSRWGVAYVLAALPLFIRLVQSIRRYTDSKLVTHLINGGKYATGIIAYFFYYYWRHYPASKPGFALYCLFSVCYSIYAGGWDLLMDWSLLRIHNAKSPLLRQELIYSRNVSVRFDMTTNTLLRFFWVIYIPHKGPNVMLRSFIAGMLEMLRRVQWNFFRLENEHLGNMDQYRVTREVPLPYSLDEIGRDDDDDGDDDVKGLRSKNENSKK
ncbi:EXS family-domain-containing protein, partial [Crepidotus variabilis]